MKKLITLAIAAFVLMSMTVTAMAADLTEGSAATESVSVESSAASKDGGPASSEAPAESTSSAESTDSTAAAGNAATSENASAVETAPSVTVDTEDDAEAAPETGSDEEPNETAADQVTETIESTETVSDEEAPEQDEILVEVTDNEVPLAEAVEAELPAKAPPAVAEAPEEATVVLTANVYDAEGNVTYTVSDAFEGLVGDVIDLGAYVWTETPGVAFTGEAAAFTVQAGQNEMELRYELLEGWEIAE